MKRFLFVSIALVGMVAGAPSAHAVLLAPGDPAIAPSALAAVPGALVDTWAGSVTALNPPTGVGQTIFGTYQEWVYQGNVFGATALTFVEQVNLASVTDIVERVTASSYSISPLVNVSYVTGTGTAPTTVNRPTASIVGFNFVPPLGTSLSTALLVIETSATNYNRLGVLSVIDATTSSNPTFQPAIGTLSVPEPSSLAIAGFGALGLIGFALRRRKALGA